MEESTVQYQPMATDNGERRETQQIEGGHSTNNGIPKDDELIAPSASAPSASAPFNPEAEKQTTVVTQNDDNNGKKDWRQGWWWKTLIVLAALFLMILFFVWIGPSYIWGKDTNSSSSNADESTGIILISSTMNPTLYPTMEPTISPQTILPTISPTSPTTALPTLSPSLNPSKRPTPLPTFCPSEQGTYEEIGSCTITERTLESCDYVIAGLQYEYDMDTNGCSTTLTCEQNSDCFNDTHYSPNGYTIYQTRYIAHHIGDTVDCNLIRNCDDASCATCSKSITYDIRINIIIVFMSIFLIFCEYYPCTFN